MKSKFLVICLLIIYIIQAISFASEDVVKLGVEITEKGTLKKYNVPHSVQDFRFILEKYGLNWDAPYQQLEFDFN